MKNLLYVLTLALLLGACGTDATPEKKKHDFTPHQIGNFFVSRPDLANLKFAVNPKKTTRFKAVGDTVKITSTNGYSLTLSKDTTSYGDYTGLVITFTDSTDVDSINFHKTKMRLEHEINFLPDFPSGSTEIGGDDYYTASAQGGIGCGQTAGDPGNLYISTFYLDGSLRLVYSIDINGVLGVAREFAGC